MDSDLPLSDDDLAAIRAADTPSICNAIEVVHGRRGFQGFTRGTILAAQPALPAIFGVARTAVIAGRLPPDEPPEIVRQRRMDYYRYMAHAPQPAVCVLQDDDYPDCVGAYWGEVNTAIHKGFGLQGALTNGVMRDLGDLEPGFQVLAGSIGPSHGWVHIRSFDTPVTVFGLTVHPGDVVHADRHGAVVIPPAVLPELPRALDTMREREALVLGPARSPGFDFDTFEAAWTAFENARV
ncbi:MAG: RraA family protein [Burkholderiaceae bacterium]